MPMNAAFAVPGDISAMTGGYLYDRSLLDALRSEGWKMELISLSDAFPFADKTTMEAATATLSKVPSDCPLIIDGLAFGALETDMLPTIQAPIIALVHHPLSLESGLPEAEARRLYTAERANLEHAFHILVPSPHIRQVLTSDYGVSEQRITVIRPGRSAFATPKQAQPGEGPPLVLSVGLLHPRKGHDVLIEALGQITDLDWRAVIVGSPWEPGHDAVLRTQIGKAGLDGRVTLAGRVAAETLEQLFSEAHLFALATRYEGYGIVFDEALIHGLPIVSTTAGAVPGTVPSDAGTLVPPENSAAFAEALRALLEDPKRHAAMAAKAREAGDALPSWADAATDVGQVLRAAQATPS